MSQSGRRVIRDKNTSCLRSLNGIFSCKNPKIGFQSQKTSHLRGFVFTNYRNLNKGNLLLETGKILKQKWHKTTKNGMLELTVTENLPFEKFRFFKLSEFKQW